MTDPSAVERYLHDHIPLSAGMGVEVRSAGADGVTLEAPLEPNLNHRATAFGGSVAALAILAGWCAVHLRLRDSGVEARTVIQRSDVAYLLPVEGRFQASSEEPGADAWRRFVRSVRRWGRGRIRMSVAVRCAGTEVARLDADYVALLGAAD